MTDHDLNRGDAAQLAIDHCNRTPPFGGLCFPSI